MKKETRNMYKKKSNIMLCLLPLLALILAACKGSDKKEMPTITVTIEPLRYFTEAIAGDKYKVVTMVPKGSSPETYEPTAKQMVDLVNSDLYIKVGDLGFERTWMKRLKVNAQHLIIIDSSEGIKRIGSSHRGETDPHTWMSAANAIVIANNIYKALKMVDNKDSVYFKERLETLCRKIMDTDLTISQMMDSAEHRSFIIYHPALTYFANDYNLKQIAIEEDGREPSAASLETLIKTAKRDSAKVMLIQKEFINRNTGIVTKATGVKVEEINPLNYDWDREMLNIATKLR